MSDKNGTEEQVKMKIENNHVREKALAQSQEKTLQEQSMSKPESYGTKRMVNAQDKTPDSDMERMYG